jgi:hypothetical protein
VGGPQSGPCLRNMNSRFHLIRKTPFCAPGNGAPIPCSKPAPPLAKTRCRVHQKTWGVPQHAKTTTSRVFCCCQAASAETCCCCCCCCCMEVLHPPGDSVISCMRLQSQSLTPSGSLRSNPSPQSNWRRCRHHAPPKTWPWPRGRVAAPPTAPAGRWPLRRSHRRPVCVSSRLRPQAGGGGQTDRKRRILRGAVDWTIQL